MTTITASEVRELAATIWPDLSGREEVAETLNAYADLLEAREKAVPVAFRYQAQQVATGAWVWSGWLDLGDPGIASLHVHCKTADSTKIEYAYAYAPPSDTERLAEALRAKIGAVIEELGLHDDYESALHVLSAELLRLANENTSRHANTDEAIDLMATWINRAQKAESELAALKARIAQAPLEVVESLPGAVGPPWPRDHWIEVRMADPCACVGQGLIGKRVRLVVEE